MVNPPSSSSGGGSSRLQQTLQAVVQSVQWTYSLFWQLCPQQGILVWGDGYYNGAIKTRKTVQPVEVSTEEASLQRSQQLRELYESLSSGEANLPSRRPCAALSPEDLTEAEWFYLMCISFSFPPGVGLPGKAFSRQRHVWLTRANEVDSKVFSRAILAKSAQVQTVVCIPVADGVLELGNTEKVEEDVALIQHAKKFFKDYDVDPPTKPALSEHSTSNPFASSADQQQLLFQQPPPLMMLQMNIDTHASNHYQEEEEEEDEEEEDGQGRIGGDVNEQFDEDDDEGDDQVIVDGSCRPMRYTSVDMTMAPSLATVEEEAINPAAEACELMQLEMSEDMRIGSVSDCSNNLNVEQMPPHYGGSQSKHHRHEHYDYKNWQFLLQDIGNAIQPSLGSQMQDFSPEDAHYSETVTGIMKNNMKRWVESSSFSYFVHKEQESAFTKWTNVKRDQHPTLLPSQGTAQWLLKNILVKIGEFHCKFNDGSSPKLREIDGGNKFQKSTAQEEISANHVLAERRRREKLNERFMVLRSLVPFVTKMDKASILGDTIEYVKQLRRRIQDLETKNRQIESDWKSKSFEVERMNQYSKLPQRSGCSNFVGSYRTEQQKRACVSPSDKRAASRSQVLGASSGDGASAAGSGGRMSEAASAATTVQVSMIDSDALLEIRCSYRDGVLLQILHDLHDLGLEFTSVQFSSTDGVFSAEIRSKVKEVHGKRTSIVDVKKAIHNIVL